LIRVYAGQTTRVAPTGAESQRGDDRGKIRYARHGFLQKKAMDLHRGDRETSPDHYSTVIAPTLLREQPRETHRRAQLQRFRLLLSREFEPELAFSEDQLARDGSPTASSREPESTDVREKLWNSRAPQFDNGDPFR